MPRSGATARAIVPRSQACRAGPHSMMDSPTTPAALDTSRPTAVHAKRSRRKSAVGCVLVIAGTRPECIKLAPVIDALDGATSLRRVLVNSGQHERAVARTFGEF